eukprot:3594097-Pyramimonas_sp.AAC.2
MVAGPGPHQRALLTPFLCDCFCAPSRQLTRLCLAGEAREPGLPGAEQRGPRGGVSQEHDPP